MKENRWLWGSRVEGWNGGGVREVGWGEGEGGEGWGMMDVGGGAREINNTCFFSWRWHLRTMLCWRAGRAGGREYPLKTRSWLRPAATQKEWQLKPSSTQSWVFCRIYSTAEEIENKRSLLICLFVCFLYVIFLVIQKVRS